MQGQTEGDIPQEDRQEQNLRFQGQYLDRETGLHYNTFRYYDADIGRFISPDPIGLLGGTNLGSYSPNPTGWIDPLGWINAPSTLPNTAGVYVYRNGNDVYVGSAGGGQQGMNQRTSDGAHSKAQDMLRKPGTVVEYHEVDLGTAKTRAEKEHVLRHFEQQVMDAEAAKGRNLTNDRRAESLKKFPARVAEVKKFGASMGKRMSC